MQALIAIVQARFEGAIQNANHVSGLSTGDAVLLGAMIVYEGVRHLTDAVLGQGGGPQALEAAHAPGGEEFRGTPPQVNVQVIPPGQPLPHQGAGQAPAGQ